MPVLTMGPAWAGRGRLKCHRRRCRPICCQPVACCPTECKPACEPVACCEVADTDIAPTPMTVIGEAIPSVVETPVAPESVVAKPTRPDGSAVTEAVPPLAPAAPVAPASVEAPVAPEPSPEIKLALQNELAGLKTELSSDMKAELSGLKTELKAERSELRAELKSDLSTMQTELKADLSKLKAELEEELAELKTEVKAQPGAIAPQQPASQAEDNIFVEEKGTSSYDDFRDEKQGAKPAAKQPAKQELPAEPKPAAETAPSPPTAAEPESPFPLPEIPAPAPSEPGIPASTLDEPGLPAPATPAPAVEDSDGSDKPASDDDPFSSLAPEPVRRWFDDSGSHDTVGRLVEVHPDRVRILKLNGRFTSVPISRLSVADRSYVTATGVRLAAKPRVTDTAAK